MATKLDKRFSDNWFMSGSYLYGESRSVNDGGSSQATSNWRYNYHDGDPNAVPLAVSDFSPGHRFSLSGSYRIPAGPGGITPTATWTGATTTATARGATTCSTSRATPRTSSSPTAPSTT